MSPFLRNQPQRPWTYRDLDSLQRSVAERVQEGHPGRLLISEVAPVITLGRRTPPSDLLVDEKTLNARGIELSPIDRGGLATYHGPGQWVIFPVDLLERLVGDPRGVRKTVEALLETALTVARIYNPRVEIRRGCELGVWSAKGKLASVGIHIADGVLLHGLSFNAFETPESFFGLRPCGLDAKVDFLLHDGLHRARGFCTPADWESEFLDLGSQLQAEFYRSFPSLSERA